MFNKDDLLKSLQNDPMYREALAMAKTDEEKTKIIASAEGFLTSFFESLIPIVENVNREEFIKALNDNELTNIDKK
jgi:hypothetical protein